MRSLADMNPGDSGVIDLIDAGIRLFNRLASMGISDGTGVTVVLNKRNGPVVIDVDGNRFAVGRGMAEKIFFKEKKSEKHQNCCCR